MTWGTAGDSRGANNSHGGLGKETYKGSHFSNTSSQVSLSSCGQIRIFLGGGWGWGGVGELQIS